MAQEKGIMLVILVVISALGFIVKKKKGRIKWIA